MLIILLILLIAMLVVIIKFSDWQNEEAQKEKLVNEIDLLLPQTQCGDCGFAGCRPYANAIANDECDINQCPPGGTLTVQALAQLLGKDNKPLNPEHGSEKPLSLALIDENTCIGCVKCIKACPVDAIIGSAKQMHTVIQERCTGCELCLPPCPVDCIDMVKAPYGRRDWHWAKPENVIQ